MNGYKESLRQYFSVQVKALRKKRKLTQEEMSSSYISRFGPMAI